MSAGCSEPAAGALLSHLANPLMLMIPLDVLLIFIAASAALALAPGPDNIFVLTQSALHGRRTGIWVTLGLCSGLLVHIAAVALGIAALLQTSALAFALLKTAGAAYLLYLAWQALRAGASPLKTAAGGAPARAAALYARGIIMNVTNPKVAIFFLAFLPQFTDLAHGPVAGQIIVLGLVFMVTSLFIFVAIACAAARLGDWLKKSPRAQVGINRLAGAIFVLLACRLVLSRP